MNFIKMGKIRRFESCGNARDSFITIFLLKMSKCVKIKKVHKRKVVNSDQVAEGLKMSPKGW